LIQTANSEAYASLIVFIQSKRVQCPDIHRILRHMILYTHLQYSVPDSLYFLSID